MAQHALDMMCERALSRKTQGSRLADKQFVQGYIADSYAQLVQFRLFVLYTAWESTEMPPIYARHLRMADVIVVPSSEHDSPGGTYRSFGTVTAPPVPMQ